MTDAQKIIDNQLTEKQRKFFKEHGITPEKILHIYHKKEDQNWEEFKEQVDETRKNEDVENLLDTANQKKQNHEETAKTSQKLIEAVITDQITGERITVGEDGK